MPQPYPKSIPNSIASCDVSLAPAVEDRMPGHRPPRGRLVKMLRGVGVFEHLDDDKLAELACRATLRRARAGSIVVGQNEPGTGLYILCQGRAKVVMFGDSGREMTLSVLGEGDLFGEVSLLDGKPSAASLVAVSDLVLLVLERSAFLEVVAQDARSAMQMLGRMAARLRRADSLIGDLALCDVGARLTKALIALGEEVGELSEDGIWIRARPTQQDLANMVGTCRETVSRALSAMARRGFVSLQGRSLLLRRKLIARMPVAA